MYKKAIPFIISSIVLGGSLTALAEETSTNSGVTTSPSVALPTTMVTREMPKTNMPTISNQVIPQVQKEMVLQIGPKGEVLLRGTLVSASTGVITVKSWGGVWTVNIPAGAEIMPTAVNNDVTKFVIGDFIGVQGYMSTSENWTINAKVVRDHNSVIGKPMKIEGTESTYPKDVQKQEQIKPFPQKEEQQQRPTISNTQQGQSIKVEQSGASQKEIQSQIQQIFQQISELRSRMDKNVIPKPATTSSLQTPIVTQTTTNVSI